MAEDRTKAGRWRPRWGLRTLMAGVAVVAVGLALWRSIPPPAAERAARQWLVQTVYTSLFFGDHLPDDYRAVSTTRTPAGDYQVRFVRVAGNGPPVRVVYVSPAYVRLFRFWYWPW